jgi:hypothetical protein
MPSLYQQYTSEIHDERGYWGTWEPNVHLTLGTCGPVQDHVLRPEGDLGQFGIGFDIYHDPQPSDTDYSSRKGLTTTFQLKGGANTIPAIPRGSAGVSIDFTRKEAVVVAVKGGREHRIADQNRLRTDLLEAAKAGRGIPKGWFVVTHLVECESATVLVALGSGAHFTMSAQADLAAGLVDVANLGLGLAINSESNIGYRMIGEQGATPLFRGLRLKRGLFGPKLETLGPTPSTAEIDNLFEELGPEALDDAD